MFARLALAVASLLIIVRMNIRPVRTPSNNIQLSRKLHARGTILRDRRPTDYAAITVVHAPCSTLPLTIANFAGVLGPEWPITIYHTDSAEASVRSNHVITSLRRQGQVTLFPLRQLGFPELPNGNIKSYSTLLGSPEFWDTVHARTALVFQSDSVLCSLSPFSVANFTRYDYIGAPFAIRWADLPDWLLSGNGGISMRSVPLMRRIVRERPYYGAAEDHYFATVIHDLQVAGENITTPTLDVAKTFAYESGDVPAAIPFAVHRFDGLEKDRRRQVLAACPEAALGVWGSCAKRRAVIE